MITPDQYVIWDLDNCLSDDRARIKLIEWADPDPTGRYAAYHAACAQDPARHLDVFYALSQLARPVFFTGRPEAVRSDTAQWVRCELSVKHPTLLMRRNNDSRPSVNVKHEMLMQYMHYISRLKPLVREECFAAFDDREEIVDMYRQCGLHAGLLSIHSDCAYAAPKAPE